MSKQPPQHQDRKPGLETEMTPKPKADQTKISGSKKLNGKVAIITGGDSGIGRAVAYAFAKEGADILIVYLDEHEDAKETQQHIEQHFKQHCICVAGDLGEEKTSQQVVEKALEHFKHIDILVNNAAASHPPKKLTEITSERLEYTFRTNIFAYFYLTKAVLPHLKKDSAIINTTSVTAYKGSAELLDYSATKGAIVSFTRSLSQALVDDGIRVNGVAPGPIWTPLIPSSFDEKKVAKFGENAPMQRAGQPEEIAPSYVFLASQDASYMTGQILHPNGGTVVNG